MITSNEFETVLREAIIDGLRRFLSEHADEHVYGFSVIAGQVCNYLGFAVATEEGLRRTATVYDGKGYKYKAHEWEQVDNVEKLTVWLRWSNPDDGWYYEEFSEKYEMPEHLQRLRATHGEEDCEEVLERTCIDVLKGLEDNAEWRQLKDKYGFVSGFTYGEDPADYVRTPTVVNDFVTTRRLWSEWWRGNELDHRIAK